MYIGVAQNWNGKPYHWYFHTPLSYEYDNCLYISDIIIIIDIVNNVFFMFGFLYINIMVINTIIIKHIM